MTDAPNPNPNPAPPPSGTNDPPVATASPPPEGHPLAAYWQADKGAFDYEKAGADWTARDTAFNQVAERMKGVPEKADAYKAEPILPEGVTLPEGAKLEFDPAAIGAASALAHQLQIPQEGFSKLLGFVAAHQVQTAQKAMAEHQAMVADEVKKLGGDEAAQKRRAPIQAYAAANFSAEEQAELNLILSTAAGTSALEKLIAKANGGPAAHPNNAPPPAPQQSQEDRWYGQRKVS